MSLAYSQCSISGDTWHTGGAPVVHTQSRPRGPKPSAGRSPRAAAPALGPAGARRAPDAPAAAVAARAPAAAPPAGPKAEALRPPGGLPAAALLPPSAVRGCVGPRCPGEADGKEATALSTWKPAGLTASTCPNTGTRRGWLQTDGLWADSASISGFGPSLLPHAF